MGTPLSFFRKEISVNANAVYIDLKEQEGRFGLDRTGFSQLAPPSHFINGFVNFPLGSFPTPHHSGPYGWFFLLHLGNSASALDSFFAEPGKEGSERKESESVYLLFHFVNGRMKQERRGSLELKEETRAEQEL